MATNTSMKVFTIFRPARVGGLLFQRVTLKPNRVFTAAFSHSAPHFAAPGDSSPPLSAEQYRKEHDIMVKAPSGKTAPEPIRDFKQVGFGVSILNKLTGYSEPSTIQAQCWPIAMSGSDMIGVAKTGSGKTLGFLLPIIHKIQTEKIYVSCFRDGAMLF